MTVLTGQLPTRSRTRRTEEGWIGRAIAIIALVLFFTVAIVVLAALTFAVHVAGSSMSPTVEQDDRLFVDILDRGDPDRFDLVHAAVPGAGIVVKRVVGMPGDTVWVTDEGGVPTVHLVPAGTDTEHHVTSPTWTSQPADPRRPCCDAEGKSTTEPTPQVVPDDSYWLIGDNWGGSDDSRVYGWVTAEEVQGTLNFRVLPVSKIGPIDNPVEMEPVG